MLRLPPQGIIRPVKPEGQPKFGAKKSGGSLVKKALAPALMAAAVSLGGCTTANLPNTVEIHQQNVSSQSRGHNLEAEVTYKFPIIGSRQNLAVKLNYEATDPAKLLKSLPEDLQKTIGERNKYLSVLESHLSQNQPQESDAQKKVHQKFVDLIEDVKAQNKADMDWALKDLLRDTIRTSTAQYLAAHPKQNTAKTLGPNLKAHLAQELSKKLGDSGVKLHVNRVFFDDQW